MNKFPIPGSNIHLIGFYILLQLMSNFFLYLPFLRLSYLARLNFCFIRYIMRDKNFRNPWWEHIVSLNFSFLRMHGRENFYIRGFIFLRDDLLAFNTHTLQFNRSIIRNNYWNIISLEFVNYLHYNSIPNSIIKVTIWLSVGLE
jgi:hypothetical protein